MANSEKNLSTSLGDAAIYSFRGFIEFLHDDSNDGGQARTILVPTTAIYFSPKASRFPSFPSLAQT